jgi:flavin reductase (DIM6/NTAB) family NADH-FMN oxidoreductase RutF
VSPASDPRPAWLDADSAVALDQASLRRAFGCFPSGVTAVCASIDGMPVGMAASSFTSVSIDPPLILVCVANESATWAQLRGASRLGLSILSADHDQACRQLAAKDGDRFAGCEWWATDDGAVFVAGATALMHCSLEEELPAGDHHIALLRIRALEADPTVAPLVFHASRFARLSS